MPRPPSSRSPIDHALTVPDAPRPLLDERRRRILVRQLRRLGGELGLYPSPKRLARVLGIRLVWRTDHDSPDEASRPADVQLYDWDPDPRQRDLNALLVLMGTFFRRERVPHNVSDVWLASLDFAVPFEAGEIDPDEMVALQRHCPEAIIRQVMASRCRG